MERPTIEIYKEIVPSHYVGIDCAIVLKHKCAKWEANLIADAIKTVLEGTNHKVLLYGPPSDWLID